MEAKLMTGNQRERDTQGCGGEGTQSASRGQEPEKELVDCSRVWKQPWQWLCQGVVSRDPARLSHLGHRVRGKPHRKRYPHTRRKALRERYVTELLNVKMSSVATPWLTQKTRKSLPETGNLKKIVNQTLILIYVEKDHQLSTFLLNCLLRAVDKNHRQNFKDCRNLSRRGNLAISRIKKKK